MTLSRQPRIAAVGMASWDHILVVGKYPEPGSYQIVRHESELPGGTTTNSAVALARLGATISLTAMIGADDVGARLRASLESEAGIHTEGLAVRTDQATDASTIIVSSSPPERTILWHQGAGLRRGDRLDITSIFNHDLVLFDVADAPLRRWITDLPAHTAPRGQLLGTLTYVAGSGEPDSLEVVLRHDAVVGSERETLLLTGCDDLDAASVAIGTLMRGSNLRTWIISRGAGGCRIVTAEDVHDLAAFPIDPVDVTGAGDAFAAGIAYGMALHWDWVRTGRLANAMGALATRDLGAQRALPSPGEVAALMGEPASTLFA